MKNPIDTFAGVLSLKWAAKRAMWRTKQARHIYRGGSYAFDGIATAAGHLYKRVGVLNFFRHRICCFAYNLKITYYRIE